MMRQEAFRVRFVLPFATCLMMVGCGGGGADQPSVDQSAGTVSNSPAESKAVEVPDACTFFARAELESIVGWELREGEPEDVSAGSSCDFEMPPQLYITRTFPDPALPESVGFSSLTINLHPSDARTFGEMRQIAGAAVEDVPGVGDDAYFHGPDLLHVRVGNRAFSVRIYTNAGSEADWARVRDVMLTLGRQGEAKLG